jgi:hypothetical protein
LRKKVNKDLQIAADGVQIKQSLRGIYRTRLDRYQHTAYLFFEGRFRSTSELSVILLPFSWATGTAVKPDVAKKTADSGPQHISEILSICKT